MRVIVIGGSGHIGTYLTPRLVEEGHTVICVSRSQRKPYLPHTAWQDVEIRTSTGPPILSAASSVDSSRML